MNKLKIKKGFSLPEVIISIALLVLVIVTATNLLVTSMRANRDNVNRIVAYNLAQEAIEGFRNIRDTYWMHNQHWRGNLHDLFGVEFTEDDKYVIIKNHNLRDLNSCSNARPDVRASAPWQLQNYSENGSKITLADKESKYKRWIKVEAIPYDLVDEENQMNVKIAITAVVEWKDGSKIKELRVSTILTDWKAGPL